MDFRVLGALEVSRANTRVQIGSRMQRRLLALLLVHAGASVHAERIVDVLWAGEPPRSALKGLHAYVSRLRGLLGNGAALEYDSHGYRLRLADDALDAWRFERLVMSARKLLAHDPAEGADVMAGALALWRGPAYGEFASEDFARPAAVRLEELRLEATEDAFDARLACGDAGLVADLEGFTAANPLRERSHAQLMTALSQAGQQSEALQVFERLRRRLRDELGLEPSPPLAQLQADILHQTSMVAGTPDIAPDPEHARIGVDEAAGGEHAGPDAAATAHEPTDTQRHLSNLPVAVTTFIGRDDDIEAVRDLLADSRLVTLTGMGGVGKTRLALHAADAVATAYPDGVWWCELAPTDTDAVDHAVADVLGAQPQPGRSIADSIAGSLAGTQMLVLDNCEHVVDASARLVEHLLRNCPDVTVLATSREPLRIDGERVWAVAPLSVPDGTVQGGNVGDHDAAGADAPAIRLFCERAVAHLPGFAVDDVTLAAVANICRQLDGLPLAIELAAALVPALDPDEIARRLDQRFGLLTHGRRTDPRHRSLTAVVEWSYQLLDPDEQRLFDRLAVFAGGFTLATAEGVCADAQLPPHRVAGLLAGLVSRSMVGVDRVSAAPRYQLLETLRQYAAEQLTARGEIRTLRKRHAAWFVDLAERADVDVCGPGEAEAVAMLEAEFANLRAAHRWTVEHGDVDLALRLAAALHNFAVWRLRDEVVDWTEEAAQLPAATGHRLQPTALGGASRGHSTRGELARARALGERALAAAPDTTDPRRLVALDSLEATALYEGRLDQCRALAHEALAVARVHGDPYNAAQAQLHDTLALAYSQQRQAALDAAAAMRATADALGNPHQQAWSRYVHAEACGDDDPETALVLLAEARMLAAPVRDRLLEGVARVAISTLRARHHSPRAALASFPDVIAHWRRAGDWTHQWTTLRNLVPLLVGLEADEAAAQLYGAQRAAGTSTYGADAARLAEAGATLTTRLGAARFESFVAQGAALGGADAVDLALSSIDGLLAADGLPAAGDPFEAGDPLAADDPPPAGELLGAGEPCPADDTSAAAGESTTSTPPATRPARRLDPPIGRGS